ncbi:hypothetical protein CBM2623_A60350 [Cupriavidus taiwanensis]|nr:hypothetical protein CBM2623_A60350 [Cupriavidus taiwanensis]SPA46568.1 hypothetical protein CBM2629_A50380 [Cupriavidus taiwanensis]
MPRFPPPGNLAQRYNRRAKAMRARHARTHAPPRAQLQGFAQELQ